MLSPAGKPRACASGASCLPPSPPRFRRGSRAAPGREALPSPGARATARAKARASAARALWCGALRQQTGASPLRAMVARALSSANEAAKRAGFLFPMWAREMTSFFYCAKVKSESFFLPPLSSSFPSVTGLCRSPSRTRPSCAASLWLLPMWRFAGGRARWLPACSLVRTCGGACAPVGLAPSMRPTR